MENLEDYSFYMVGDRCQLLRTLCCKETSLRVESFDIQEGTSYRFCIKGIPSSQQRTIEYTKMNGPDNPKDLSKVEEALDIKHSDLTRELRFSQDHQISETEVQTLERIASQFKNKGIPFVMYHHHNHQVVGGYQPEGNVLYQGPG